MMMLELENEGRTVSAMVASLSPDWRFLVDSHELSYVSGVASFRVWSMPGESRVTALGTLLVGWSSSSHVSYRAGLCGSNPYSVRSTPYLNPYKP